MPTTSPPRTTTIPCRSSAATERRLLLFAFWVVTTTALAPSAHAQGEPAQTPQPQPAIEPEAKPTSLKAPPQMRKNTLGIGPGFVFWPPPRSEPDGTYEIAAALALQHRKAVPIAGIIGWEWTTDIVFHDWKGMGDAYKWYFAPAETEDEKDMRAIKTGLLWPGLILIPFGGANYTTGFGLVVWTSRSLPAVYFDAGINLTLWLRLSDPQFRADFGFGPYGGVGFDMLENVGANLRVMWGAPAIHTLLRQSSGGITTVTLNINFFH